MIKSAPGDNRTALIVCLIAIPFAFLIASLVHWFMPLPQPEVPCYPVSSSPRKMQRPPMMPNPEPKPADAIAAEKVKLLQQLYDYRKSEYESGAIAFSKVLEAEKNLTLAKAAAFRNGKRGFSPAEIYISYVYAGKAVAEARKSFDAGKQGMDALLEAKIIRLDREKQMDMPFMKEESFLAAAEAWEKTPNDETLKAMVLAEPARGGRPF